MRTIVSTPLPGFVQAGNAERTGQFRQVTIRCNTSVFRCPNPGAAGTVPRRRLQTSARKTLDIDAEFQDLQAKDALLWCDNLGIIRVLV
ncbi:MAG: hypothetical protein ACRYHQ_33930 [Janthinobacterium lividum]